MSAVYKVKDVNKRLAKLLKWFIFRKWLAADKRSEPRHGERVPYVIINGPPGLPLIKLVRSPRELLSDSSLLPNITYYITRAIIPPLNRCFTLIGADLNVWYVCVLINLFCSTF